jgi:hypothetical protein
MKIVGLSLLLVAIIFVSTTFGTFEGMEPGMSSETTTSTDKKQSGMGMVMDSGMMPSEVGMMPSTSVQAGFRSR